MLNQVVMVGRLVADPEVKETENKHSIEDLKKNQKWGFPWWSWYFIIRDLKAKMPCNSKNLKLFTAEIFHTMF